jgi:serine/threonine protein kinase
MSQVTILPINLASVKDLESPTLVGQGSFGKVYLDSKTNKVYKKSDTIIYKDNDYIIIENNIRELVFYTYIKEKFGTSTVSSLSNNTEKLQGLSFFLDSVEHISIPHKIEVVNNVSKIYLEHNGIPLSKYKYESLNELKLIFSQICSTVYSFYCKGMTHGDIKPSNILIKKEKIPFVKLIDFGSVQFNHLYKIKQKHQRCSLLYVSPEELEEYVYSLYNDWWGVGVSMFEIIT